MPELPEVETSCQGIAPHITQQTVVKVVVRNPRLRWPVPKQLNAYLAQQKIQQVLRRAKYLLLQTANGTVIIHLGMSGSLRIVQQDHPPQKHDHVDFIFKNGLCLRLTDPRRFGAVLWTKENPYQHSLLINLGPEPLGAEFSAKYLFTSIRRHKQAIKVLLMNSQIVVGVGNIYANEALFRARIHPQLPAQQLTLKQCAQLVTAVKQVLAEAIKFGGTTLKDFLKGDGKPGYFRNELRVYGRGGLPCLRCKTPLIEIRIGQRSTVFCASCQCNSPDCIV